MLILYAQFFYLGVMKYELGISNHGNIICNEVYKPVYQEADDIYKFNEQKLLSTFGMELLDIKQYIPLLYWTSENVNVHMHFDLLQGFKCYNKQLAIEPFLTLKCIKHHFKNYCKGLVNKISDKKARSFKTFEFSTLYANLPLDVSYVCK